MPRQKPNIQFSLKELLWLLTISACFFAFVRALGLENFVRLVALACFVPLFLALVVGLTVVYVRTLGALIDWFLRPFFWR